MKVYQMLILAAAMAAVIISCQPTKKKVQVRDFSKAEEMFTQNCSGCHGVQMVAFTDREWKHGNETEDLVNSITNGWGEAGMPSFKALFSKQEIQLLADYIRTGIENREAFDFEEEKVTGTFDTDAGFQLELDTIYQGEIPWGMAFLPNGEMLVTEREGQFYKVSADRTKTEISGAPDIWIDDQAGLLDVELHPDFENNNYIYLSYSKIKEENGKSAATTAVSRYKFTGNAIVEPLEVFAGQTFTTKEYHFGCRLEFDKDGYLFITMGDRGKRDQNPQDLSRRPGKVHRIYDDGSIPEDNPFVGQENVIESIYSYGHRNPQGLVYDPVNDLIITHEHGPRGGDELNIIEPGKNYGWPVVSYGINYDGTIFTSDTARADFVSPVTYWVPSIAPCGLDIVNSDIYPGWKGSLLLGSMRFKYLARLELINGIVTKEESLIRNVGRVRNVQMGPDGYIYIAEESEGYIFRLVPKDIIGA